MIKIMKIIWRGERGEEEETAKAVEGWAHLFILFCFFCMIKAFSVWMADGVVLYGMDAALVKVH